MTAKSAENAIGPWLRNAPMIQPTTGIEVIPSGI